MGKYICPFCGEQFDFIPDILHHLEICPEKGTPEAVEMAKQTAIMEDQLKIVEEYTRLSDETKVKKEAASYYGVTPPEIPVEDYGRTPEELARHMTSMYTLAGVTTVTGGLLIGATYLASLTPFSSVGDVVDEVWRLPIFSAPMSAARDTLMSSYNYINRPLMQRHWYHRATPLLPETYRLALAASKEIAMPIEYKEAMAQSGLNEGWADMWKEQNYVYPALETALRLLRRGEISETDFDLWMKRSSLPEATRKEVIKLKEVIPPLPDLIRFAVREAFGEHTFEEQYPTYESIAMKMGLTKEAAMWYWYSHWIRISVDRMYDNLYRGYWDEEKFKSYLRLVDIHPDDREDIYNVAFRPPTVRELGYGYDVGAYTREDILKFRRWGGLSPEDATKAADALVDYRLEAEREAVRREHMYLYVMGKETEEEFRANLENVFTIDTRSDLWVERGRLQVERKSKPLEPLEYRVVTASEAKWHFTHGLRDVEWYKSKLADLDWDEERIKVAVERALEEIKVVPPEEVPVEYRKLTISQIGDLYRFRKIGADLLPVAFEGIGYSPAVAQMLAQVLVEVSKPVVKVAKLSRADVERMYDLGILTEEQLTGEYLTLGYDRRAADYLTLRTKISIWFPDLKAMYSKGWITAETMFNELLLLGLPRERAEYLMMTVVKAEQPERVAAERDLTKSEIVKGAKAEIVTPRQAVGLLMDLGYEEWESWYILAINKVVEAGDPESYWEMKRVTEAYKKAVGAKYKEVPDNLLIWEQRVKQLHAEVEKLKEEEAPEDKISEALIRLNNAEANYRKLIQVWEKEGR